VTWTSMGFKGGQFLL